MKKIFLTVALAFSLFVSRAQDASRVAMGFAAIPRSTESLGMGGVSGFDNVAYRPFGSSVFAAEVSYAMWAPKSATPSNDINIGLSGKIADKLGLKAGFSMDNAKPYNVYDDTGVSKGSFTPKDMLFSIGASYKIAPVVSLGLTFKSMSSTLSPSSKISGIGFDVVAAGSFKTWKYAAGVTSLGGKVKSVSGKEYSLPSSIMIAGGYCNTFAEKHGLDVDVQADVFFKGGLRACLGAAYSFNDLLAVRLGYNYGGKTVLPSFFSAGIGVKFAGISINGTFLFGSVLSPTMQFGLGYSF